MMTNHRAKFLVAGEQDLASPAIDPAEEPRRDIFAFKAGPGSPLQPANRPEPPPKTIARQAKARAELHWPIFA